MLGFLGHLGWAEFFQHAQAAAVITKEAMDGGNKLRMAAICHSFTRVMSHSIIT
jgi:hypothetical protein